MRMRPVLFLTAVAIGFLGLAGCSEDADQSTTTPEAVSTTETQTGGHGGGGGGGYGGGGGHWGGGHGGGHQGGGHHGGGGCDGDENQGETGFAYACDDALCFRDIDANGDGNRDFSRWGWTNGPFGPGSYAFDLYAGAGQCDIERGTLVGQVLLTYDGSTARVEYVLCGNYGLSAVHTFVGNEILPRKNGHFTVAPGRYPYGSGNLNGDQYHDVVFDGLSGDIYVVAHSVVTGNMSDGDCGERGCTDPCVPGFHPEVLDAFLPATPVSADFNFQGNVPLYGANDAYVQTSLIGAGGLSSPAGVFDYPTWCVDGNHPLGHHGDNLFMVSSYSSNAALLACLVDLPQNLDLVNWVLNQDPATWGADQRDVQAAIWALIETSFSYCGSATCTKGGITYTKAIVQAIVADAQANGEGFTPPCDGVIAVFLDTGCTQGLPIDQQVTILELPLIEVPGLCEDCIPVGGGGSGE